MPDTRERLSAAVGIGCCILLAALVFAIGLLPALFWGFAWGVILTVAVGLLVGRISGGGIDGGYATMIAWVILAAGFVVGCGWRYLPLLWRLFFP